MAGILPEGGSLAPPGAGSQVPRAGLLRPPGSLRAGSLAPLGSPGSRLGPPQGSLQGTGRGGRLCNYREYKRFNYLESLRDTIQTS